MLRLKCQQYDDDFFQGDGSPPRHRARGTEPSVFLKSRMVAGFPSNSPLQKHNLSSLDFV